MTTKEQKNNTPKEVIKSVAWLIEAAFRGFVAYILIVDHRHNYFAMAAGIYALATATMIVVAHFVKAHK